jgi:hypothetical protein
MCTMRKRIESSLLRMLGGALLCLALILPTVAAAATASDGTSGSSAVAQQAASGDISAAPSAAGCAKIGIALILVGVAFLAFRRSAGSRQASARSTGVLALVIAAALLYLALPASGSFRQSVPPARESSAEALQGMEQLAARAPRQPTPIPTRPPSTPVPTRTLTPCVSC